MDDTLFYFHNRWSLVVFGAAMSACLWIPIVFGAYALGRRRVGIWFFFALITAEAFAVWTLIIYTAGPP